MVKAIKPYNRKQNVCIFSVCKNPAISGLETPSKTDEAKPHTDDLSQTAYEGIPRLVRETEEEDLKWV